MQGPKVNVNEIWRAHLRNALCSLARFISSCCSFLFSKVSVEFEFILCLYSSPGIPAWEGRAVASLASLCSFPCTVLFCGPYLPILKIQYESTVFNFPVLNIPASLEDSELCQSWFGFFFHSDFSIIWVIYGWDKLPGSCVCYHSNHTPGNKSSSQLFCIFFYVCNDGVCWVILAAHILTTHSFGLLCSGNQEL